MRELKEEMSPQQMLDYLLEIGFLEDTGMRQDIDGCVEGLFDENDDDAWPYRVLRVAIEPERQERLKRSFREQREAYRASMLRITAVRRTDGDNSVSPLNAEHRRSSD